MEAVLIQMFAVEGEILAFHRQADSTDYLLRALVEFADVEIPELAAFKYHCAVVAVRRTRCIYGWKYY
jgi:hypothetical protein